MMGSSKTQNLFILCVLFLGVRDVKGFLSRCGGQSLYLTAKTYATTYTPYYYHYPSNDYCYWKITALYSTMVVQLTFTAFNLESSSSCRNDYLSIYDGSSYASPIIGKYCGTERPPMIVSKGRYLYLKFRSDMMNNYRGFTMSFKAKYQATVSGKCSSTNSFAKNNDIQLSSTIGYIYSPGYPFYYPNNMQCTWKIKVPSGKKVKLYFESFGISYSLNCKNDYLRVRDGYYSTSTLKGDYCGTTRRTIYSSDRYLWLRFRSDYISNYKGFKLRYTTESSSSSSSSVGVIIGVIIGIAVVVAVIVAIVYCTKKNRRGVVQSTAAPSTITTTTTVAPTQNVPLQPMGNAPPPYQNPYPQKGQPYPGPPPLGYAGPPPQAYQGYAGPPPTGAQGYAGPPPPGAQGYAGPPPAGAQGYAGPPPAGAQGYAGPPPPGAQGYAGPPPPGAQGYAGPPLTGAQGYAGPPPPGAQGYAGPPPQGYQGPPLPDSYPGQPLVGGPAGSYNGQLPPPGLPPTVGPAGSGPPNVSV